MSYQLSKAFNESDHPRSNNGRFTSKNNFSGKGNKIKSLISQFKDFKPIKINAQTNKSIEVTRNTFKHILHHGAKKEAHIDSVLVIPEIVKKMLFVGSEPNQDLKVNPDIEKYNYYISCISVNGKEYIVKSVIGISKGNTKYYDHAVISQSKSEFVETLSEISETRESTNPLLQQDKRLFNILQAESLRKSLDYQIINGNYAVSVGNNPQIHKSKRKVGVAPTIQPSFYENRTTAPITRFSESSVSYDVMKLYCNLKQSQFITD